VLENGNGQIVGALIVPVCTFFIAFELWRERRRTRYSRAAAIVVPCLHAGIFLVPLAMHAVWLRSIAPYDQTQPVDSDRFYDAYIEFVLKGLRP